MLQLENPLAAAVPKRDGRSALDGFPVRRRLPTLGGAAASAALVGGGACTVLWLGFLAWCLFRFARLVIG